MPVPDLLSIELLANACMLLKALNLQSLEQQQRKAPTIPKLGVCSTRVPATGVRWLLSDPITKEGLSHGTENEQMHLAIATEILK